jgi:hypothetical protein
MKPTMTRLFAGVTAIGAVLAAMLLFSTGASAAPPTYPPSSSSSSGGIHISNSHPKAGSNVTVHGSSCTVGATVTVLLDGVPQATGTVNAAGRYNITFKIPKSTSAGHHTISIQVSNGTCAGSGTLGIEVEAANNTQGGGGTLAGTGVAVVGIGALGVVLLAGGGMMLLAGRRRGNKHA